ncbi:glycosyltransferase family 2 protein [Evansella sp. AB-rgal1]|uniref:glycosyltransferase family 2 protein n=1 Tax=Evansella sp. AB-rgal1 TaxID=3242696 RepID=UPI00359D12D4
MVKISIGIITYNRPDNLEKCILSIEKSINFAMKKGHEVMISDLIVSDDGNRKGSIIQTFYKFNWKKIKGPQKGIGANRNNVIRNVSGDWCLMVDDDIELSEEYIYHSLTSLNKAEKKTILTGVKYEDSREKIPTQSNFWGYRKDKINSVKTVKGFLDQASWIPITAASTCSFDESVNYGPSEMDFAYQLLFNGYKIEFDPSLIIFDNGAGNTSVPKKQLDIEASRIYYMLRRYRYWEKSTIMFCVFIVLEPLRLTIALVRRKKIEGLFLSIKSYAKGMSFFLTTRNSKTNT